MNHFLSAAKVIQKIERQLDTIALELIKMPDGTTKEFNDLARKYVKGKENIETLKLKQ